MERLDIEITSDESFYFEYPSAEKTIVSILVNAKKRHYHGDVVDISEYFSISGDIDDLIIADIQDTSFMEDWDQWAYDIRAVDSDGNVFYPFYGLIYQKGGIKPRRDSDLPS